MTLTLHVDGDRWRAHLRSVVERHPGIVPVAKGNGYGFGIARLARRAEWLGVDTVAVGTYDEIPEVASRFGGDLLVLTPWRSFLAPSELPDRRVIHTVGRLDDLAALAVQEGERPRVVLERATSMLRHGFTARGLRQAALAASSAGVRVEGVALHLPLALGTHLLEVTRLMNDVVASGLTGPDGAPLTVFVSHLSDKEMAQLATEWPDYTFRPRVGTALWLGDRGALRVTATVLDVHDVERGDVFGYRGRTAPRAGAIVVVSGGTAHGIGLEAPNGDQSLRSRATALAKGGLDALGMARSPFTVGGKQRYFAEPPHMQASMLYLPSGAAVPEIGETVTAQVRFTASYFDGVDIS